MSESNPVLVDSFKPPSIPELHAAAGDLPGRILLAARVYFDRGDESTRAAAETSKGHKIEVSIRFAAPPNHSYVCIYCPELKEVNFADEPRVVRSEKQFLLLHLPLTFGHRMTLWEDKRNEYFLYKAAASPSKPSLRWIPAPGPPWLIPAEIGICCDAEEEEYILAALCLPSSGEGYELHTFTCKSVDWTVKLLFLEKPPKRNVLLPVSSHKVVPLGGTMMAWVDLLNGILTCNVATDDAAAAVVSFIRLPDRLPRNQSEFIIPWKIRDVIFNGGSLKFIEVENLYTQEQDHARADKSSAPSDPDIVYDDIDSDTDESDSVPTPPTWTGWRSVIWNRALSDKFWRKACEAHSGDILVENPGNLASLAQLGDDSVQDCTLMNLRPYFPTLSIFGDDVVYMNSLLKINTRQACVVAIDLRNKTVISLAPYPGCRAEKNSNCPHFPSVLSQFLNYAPAVPRIVETSKSEHVMANQSQRSCAEELITASNEAQNYLINLDYSSVPQRSFGLLHAATNQYLLPIQQPLTHLPNLLQIPCWTPSEFGNTHPVDPAVFGQMLHPVQMSYGLLQPPPPPPPFTLLPPVPEIAAANCAVAVGGVRQSHAAAAKSVLGGGRRTKIRHAPYSRCPRQKILLGGGD